MKQADMTIGYHFYVKCPLCGTVLDLADGDNDSDGEFSTPIFNNRWDDLRGKIVSCSFCDQDFQIREVEI